MKPYQIEGMIWMANLRKVKANGILADEMGLGKTLQTISLFCHTYEVDKNAGPFLVIAPLSTLLNWIVDHEICHFVQKIPHVFFWKRKNQLAVYSFCFAKIRFHYHSRLVFS